MVRALALPDVPGLLAVQRACYGEGLVESGEVFAHRLASAANCSWVLTRDETVCAYLAAYGSQQGKVTPLHGDFEATTAPDTLYLHDLAVLPSCAGQGLARALLRAAWAQAAARGLGHAALVSVQGSQAYWTRQGFGVQALACEAQQAHLASYGDGAVYMARALTALA